MIHRVDTINRGSFWEELGGKYDKLIELFLESLKGSSAYSKASDYFSFEIPAFSKLLITVLVVTFPQATSNICITSSIKNSGSSFFFSIASINFLIDIVLYRAFNDRITP